MAFRANRRWTTRAAILLASTTAPLILSAPTPAFSQTASRVVAASETVNFSIPAQSLASALNDFARATGWQLGYQSAITQGRQSVAVTGQRSPVAALQEMLRGTGISIRVTGPGTVSLTDGSVAQTAPDGSTILQEITINAARSGVSLGTDSVADTGTSVISGGQLQGRIDGNDANGVLRNLPNVQYQNDIGENAGITDLSVIDTRPREVSIAGARVYENNFILNGIGINDVTGSQEGFAGDNTLDDSTIPTGHRIYGLHSQTIYVPGEFVSEATVIDSNASASYGSFQGGVVSYKMEDANRERLSGSIGTEYTTSDWASYQINTPTGLNPRNVARQEYLKRRFSASLSGPITENIAVLGQYSKQTAVTRKAKSPQYINGGMIEEDSANEFYRGQVLTDTDLGLFTLEGFYTDYNMFWESASWRNARTNLAKDSFSSKLQNDYEFKDFSISGIEVSNVKLTSKLSYGRSNSMNDANGNVARSVSTVRNNNIRPISDWCRAISGSGSVATCNEGALGDIEQGQQQASWSQELTGEVWNGSFKLGGDYTHTDARRRRAEDVVYYNNYGFAPVGSPGFICGVSEACDDEMYAKSKQTRPAFDIGVKLNEFNIYSELDQTWDWFNLRTGMRFSYNDYMNNLDIAPRITGTFAMGNDLSFSAGYNRYFNAASLAFAIRDKQPRWTTQQRENNDASFPDWRPPAVQSMHRNLASGLKTPYNDELALGLSGKEPFMGGEWRLRYLHRFAEDQFATEASGVVRTLTNNASGTYQSATAEYSKQFDASFVPKLDNLSFNTSITWSKSTISNDSYFQDDLEDEYIWYKGKSYTRAGFNVVTGNMDIPLRLQAGFSTAWLDDRLLVDVSGNYNFAYVGARKTDDSDDFPNKDNVITRHEIWADYDFDPALTVDLSARYLVYKKEHANLSLNFKVLNVFDETGNAYASVVNPWAIGRTVWVGAKAEF